MNSPQRFHSLDHLRAIMMWLGIVLHVAINHTVGRSSIPWRDPETTQVADFLLGFIHAFRMPVFFILAGFFVALLVERRGYQGMLKHRIVRIGVPFAIFWPLVFIATTALVGMYFRLMYPGSPGFTPGIAPEDSPTSLAGAEGPTFRTMHLWFIYYLLWYCAATAICGLLGRHIPKRCKAALARGWQTLASHWWGFIFLTLPLAWLGSFYWNGMVTPEGSFMPRATEFIHNGMFYVFGWYLYQDRDRLLSLYARHSWRYLAAGALFFFASLPVFDALQKSQLPAPYLRNLVAFLFHSASWLWSFGLIGLFWRYLSTPNRGLAYIAQSSYWVYIVHFSLTVGFGALLFDAPYSALTKMGINIAATTVVCLISYHVLVRYTPLGTLLNGYRHPLPFSVRTAGIAGAIIFVTGLGLSQIKLSQNDAPNRTSEPLAIAVPTEVEQLLRELGDAYGSRDSMQVERFLASDFLHQGMDKVAFLDHLKKYQRYLGKLAITPVGFEQKKESVQLAAYAVSTHGVLAPALQLLPLQAGALLVQEQGQWKLRGNQQGNEVSLHQAASGILADFAPSDLDAYRRHLPAGYGMPAQPYVRVSVSYWKKTAQPHLPYRLAQLSILASKDGENIWHVLQMPQTDWLAVESGKALGFPNFIADFDIRRSLGNQWQVALQRAGEPLADIGFDAAITTKSSTYYRDWPNNTEDWLIFDRDGVATKAVMLPDGAANASASFGWMTVNAHAPLWKELLAPNSRALARSSDTDGQFKLHLYPAANAAVPADIQQLLDKTADAWARQDMEGVLAQHHPAFMVTNQQDLVAMRKVFPHSRRYEWRVKDMRINGQFAYLKGEIQTEAGAIPAKSRLVKEKGRWLFYGDGGSWHEWQMTRTVSVGAADEFDAHVGEQAQKVVAAKAGLHFDAQPMELGPLTALRNAVFKPAGTGPFPALVLLPDCGGRMSGSLRKWAEAAVEQGYVVMVVDSLRGHPNNCIMPLRVPLGQRVKDAQDALDYLSKLPMVDANRIAAAGFSQGGTIALLLASNKTAALYGGSRRYAAVSAIYPQCFMSSRFAKFNMDFLRPDIDTPLLTLMGGEDIYTPAYDCVPHLEQLQAQGKPVEWHVFPQAVHGWDIAEISGGSITTYRGDRMTFSYDKNVSAESRTRLFDFLSRKMPKSQAS